MLNNRMPSGTDSEGDALALARLVIEITRRFALSLELGEVLSEVLSLTVDTLGADTGSIFLFDGEQRVIRHILARRNLPAEESEQAVSAVLDRGLAGWAVRNRQVALIQDTATDARWHHLPGDELNTRSAIAVPLLHRGQLNGLLTLTSSQPATFTQQHLELSSAIAGQAATAVENARLFTRVSEERAVLQALINGVQQPIIVTDSDNRVRYTNPAAQTLSEGLDERAIGQPVQDVVPSERLAALFRDLLASGQPQRDEVPCADGRTFYANLVLVPGVGAVAALHDVTHFKELDRLKTEFVATVSHDLKSPLTVIQGYTELLQEALPDPDALAVTGLQEIAASVTRMQNLITTLLDIAQIESGLDRAKQPCQVSDIVADVIQAHRLPAEEKQIRLDVNVAADLPPLVGHPVRLEQALANLVGNAIKYTPPDGRVAVSARCSGEKLVVQVRDTGPGIPLDKQAGLFSKFYKVGAEATRGAEGHGLGLAIVKSVVEAHHGHVWVESDVGHGATFAFSLPLANGLDRN